MQKPEQSMLLPLAALALFSLLVKALALSGLQDFAEDPQQQGFVPGTDHQYILTGTRFRTKACVHQVKVFAEAHGGIFALDVWRLNGQSSYTLASSVEFTPREQTRTVFLLDASPPVQFQAKDLMGFHLVDNAADFQVGWTSAPGMSLTMSTQRGSSPVTTFPGSSWMATGSTWPILFLSTSDTGICSKSTFATDSQTSTKTLKPSSTMAAPSSPPNEIMPVSSATFATDSQTITKTLKPSSTMAAPSSPPNEIMPVSSATFATDSQTSTNTPTKALFSTTAASTNDIMPASSVLLSRNIDASSSTVDMSPDFPGDSSIPPEGIAGIIVAAIVVIVLLTSSIILIAVCRLKTRKGSLSWKVYHNSKASHPVMSSMLMNSLATSTSPLIKGEEPRGAVAVVIQPNPAYATTFTSSNSTAPSALTPSPANHNPLVVMQPNPAYSAARPTVLSPAPPPASSTTVPTPLHWSPPLLASDQANHCQVQVDEATDHTYSSVSTCTGGTNVYEYVDH